LNPGGINKVDKEWASDENRCVGEGRACAAIAIAYTACIFYESTVRDTVTAGTA
jgi:hypothetical protein